MQRPSKQVVKRDLHALAKGVVVGCVIIAVVAGLFVAIWGWQRFLSDFWPLDKSTVGPNMVASVVTAVLVVAHNEGRVVQRDTQRHLSLEETLRDMLAQVLHPVETAEDSVAQRVIEGQNDGV